MIRVELKGDWDRVFRFFKEAKKVKRTKRAIGASMSELSKQTRDMLKDDIVSGDSSFPMARGTRRKRERGKLKGAHWRAIPAYGGSTSLLRSGALASAIQSAKRKWNIYAVGVENRPATYAGGAPISLPDLAAQMEHGYAMSIDITFKMQAYLHILYGASLGAKGSRSHLPEGSTGRQLRVSVPGRPVWRYTFLYMAADAAGRIAGRAFVNAPGAFAVFR